MFLAACLCSACKAKVLLRSSEPLLASFILDFSVHVPSSSQKGLDHGQCLIGIVPNFLQLSAHMCGADMLGGASVCMYALFELVGAPSYFTVWGFACAQQGT